MFAFFKDLLSIYKTNPIHIDNNIFVLHYRVTVAILVTFSIVLSAKQLVGEPITCLPGSTAVNEAVINHYCWITATYTIPESEAKQTGLDRISPGVSDWGQEGEVKEYHNYYQWVCFIFFFQAALFYLPRIFWRISEGGLIKMMSTSLVNASLGIKTPPDTAEIQAKHQGELIKEYFLHKYHQRYVLKFIVCEILNTVNVACQIVFVDYFVDGEFRRYGFELFRVIQLDFKDRTDPITNIFPVVSKCSFYLFGGSGQLQRIDSLCVLPLNVVNEKFFIILWVWLLVLAVFTGLNLFYRFFVVCFKPFRYCMLRARVPTYSGLVRRLSYELDLGDWFVLYQLSKNVYIGLLHDLMVSLVEKIDEERARKNFSTASAKQV